MEWGSILTVYSDIYTNDLVMTWDLLLLAILFDATDELSAIVLS